MCEVTSWQGAAIVAWAIAEFWLGKTGKVKAGSTVELILNSLKSLLGLIKK